MFNFLIFYGGGYLPKWAAAYFWAYSNLQCSTMTILTKHRDLKARVFKIVMTEKASDENKDVHLTNALIALKNCMRKGRLHLEYVNTLNAAGVYILGLLTPKLNKTPVELLEEIKANGLKVSPLVLEAAVLDSDWFYQYAATEDE